ncbi:MAG: CARDB domain-containing protein, partial [Anaerolineae bacterium]
LTAVISNTGPAELPAGAAVTLYEGEMPLGETQLLPALAAGQASTVSAPWTRPGPGEYEFRAVVDVTPEMVLCATPPMGHDRLGPDVDLRISKSVQPGMATPGDVITYTLVYSNAGAALATGVAISDPLPAEILAPVYQSAGAVITPVVGSGNFAWQVADLAGGEGGQIVINGMMALTVTTPITLTNVVTVTAPLEGAPGDNVAWVDLPVGQEVGPPQPRFWLPLIVSS